MPSKCPIMFPSQHTSPHLATVERFQQRKPPEEEQKQESYEIHAKRQVCRYKIQACFVLQVTKLWGEKLPWNVWFTAPISFLDLYICRGFMSRPVTCPESPALATKKQKLEQLDDAQDEVCGCAWVHSHDYANNDHL